MTRHAKASHTTRQIAKASASIVWGRPGSVAFNVKNAETCEAKKDKGWVMNWLDGAALVPLC